MLDRTGHHFLLITFVATKPDGSQVRETRSAFIVDVRGVWLLMTAGHVLRTLREEYPRIGVTTSRFELQDRFAGSSFSGHAGVPFHFDSTACMELDEEWGDFGLIPLDALTVSQLKRGNVIAIKESAWGTRPLEEYTHLLLTGVPSETVTHEPGQMVLRHTLIPLALCPPNEQPPAGQVGKIKARLLQDESELAQLDDIDGMSGGPIFGVRDVDGVARYFLVGVQSGWLRQSRIVTFSAAAPVLKQLRADLIERAATKRDDRQTPSQRNTADPVDRRPP